MNTENFDIVQIKEIVIGYLTNCITDAERITLDRWLKQNPEHVQLFNEMVSTWQFAATIKKSSEEELQVPWQKLESRIGSQSDNDPVNSTSGRIAFPLRRLLGIAASLLFAFFIGGMSVHFFAGKNKAFINPRDFQVYIPNGTRSEIFLADGTQVWLNAGSTLKYSQDYNMNTREVELIGEAFFNVKTNRNKPFVVKSSGLRIKAIGTSFNIKAYPGEKTLTATLVEGRLVVEGKSEAEGNFNYALVPRQSLVLITSSPDKTKTREKEASSENMPTTKQRLPAPEIRSIKLDSNVNTELFTSWKDRQWVIESVSLVDLIVMLERRYNVKMIYDPDEFKDLRFSGKIENETIEQLLDILKMSAPIKYEFGKGEVLLSIDKNLQKRFQKLINAPS